MIAGLGVESWLKRWPERVALRQQLRLSGYSPCEGKAVGIVGWQLKYDTNDGEIDLWDKIYPNASNAGLMTRRAPTVDIDITDEEPAEAAWEPRSTGRAALNVVRFAENEPEGE
jgi:hypothetical protein